MKIARLFRNGYLPLLIGLCITAFIYWPGLYGGWLFDDYPNIVDNPGVQPDHFSLGTLVRAALSSPASEFKRPLASFSFALNYLASGLDPFEMKLTNLVIHLLNGLLVFVLMRALLTQTRWNDDDKKCGRTAALMAIAWLLLPINITSVLYVVQRMESLANLFVLIGLIGYIASRRQMLHLSQTDHKPARQWLYFGFCAISILAPTAVGVLAKETAVMLPLYAFLVEWAVFRFNTTAQVRDYRLVALFTLTLVLPLIIGLIWLAPQIANPAQWSTRDFTLQTRLLSEARIVVAYVAWTLLPLPHELSFYHDNFHISTDVLIPWTTLASILTLLAMIGAAWRFRSRRPLIALGIALYLGCHLLTATVLPLELVYEHRNYFASIGLILAAVPALVATNSAPFPILRRAALLMLLLLWTTETRLTAEAWGEPLLLAQALADRAPDSPRAQYELGRTYIIYSHYDPMSPYTHLAYAPLERAAALPESSVLPEQALIFMNARMNLPTKDAWWDSMIQKLKSHRPTIQDESSLATLTECARDGDCNLPRQRMQEAFQAAFTHLHPSARLLSTYADFSWNVQQDHAAGLSAIKAATAAAPREPAYRITFIRMLVAQRQLEAARAQLEELERMNVGGYLDGSVHQMQTLLNQQ
ncbi:hypothetical protein [Dyella acidiphila]|uniref:Tetratricopeptide repeat protein n=1 Tax=Dyella acidiphila TaxID=2775866 RepID=A0ABR9G8R4_9GAMM|nr:hypothetical protein [Dyella acidiphila]MBE1160436.1 hypothetical protein [Dyella acidiphila]